MGNLSGIEYDGNIEKSINEALLIMNCWKRIEALKAIDVPKNSRYNKIIQDCIVDAMLKPPW